MKKEGFAGKPIEQHPSSIVNGLYDCYTSSIPVQEASIEKLKSRIAELEAALDRSEKRNAVYKKAHDHWKYKYASQFPLVGSDAARAALGEKE